MDRMQIKVTILFHLFVFMAGTFMLYSEKIYDVLTNEWTEYWLIKAIYLRFLIVSSLISASAVVYTITHIFSGNEITFQKVMSIVSNVCKRLMVTFLCGFGTLIIYNLFSLLFFMSLLVLLKEIDFIKGFVVTYICVILYFLGLLYASLIWQLATAISVLEESYGFKAMMRSLTLIKGRMGISLLIYLAVNLCLVGTQLAIQKFLVIDPLIGVLGKIGLAALSLGFICLLLIFGLVLQIIAFYVVWKYYYQGANLRKVYHFTWG